MKKPWKLRPKRVHKTDSPVDYEMEMELDWEDNWLSNSMAWTSKTFLPNWCQTADHWSSRFTNYFWAECPCCNAWRGLAIGAMIGVIFGLTVGLIF